MGELLNRLSLYAAVDLAVQAGGRDVLERVAEVIPAYRNDLRRRDAADAGDTARSADGRNDTAQKGRVVDRDGTRNITAEGWARRCVGVDRSRGRRLARCDRGPRQDGRDHPADRRGRRPADQGHLDVDPCGHRRRRRCPGRARARGSGVSGGRATWSTTWGAPATRRSTAGRSARPSHVRTGRPTAATGRSTSSPSSSTSTQPRSTASDWRPTRRGSSAPPWWPRPPPRATTPPNT